MKSNLKASPHSDLTRLNLVYYGPHDPVSESRILNVRPEYLIDNTAHGLWGEVTPDNPALLRDTAPYRAAGIRIIGYITSGYEGRGSQGPLESSWYTLTANKRFISDMAEKDGVAGVFIDECTAFPSTAAGEYLHELASFAHERGLMVWGNAGAADFDGWYFTGAGFDMMNSSENWADQRLNKVYKKWGNRISVTGYNPNATARNACDMTMAAWRKGLAYCYMSNVAYTGLPTWVEEYAALLRAGRQG